MTTRDKNTSQENRGKGGKQRKGFAAMPHEKVQEIASKGGHASAEKAGHEGMSARGHKGGLARKAQLGPEGYSKLGRAGGQARSASALREGGENDYEE